MIIKHVSRAILESALQDVNAIYRQNIVFRDGNFFKVSDSRGGGETWHVRLSVLDSHAAGAKRNPISGRRIKTTCWHVVGNFFDSLPADAVVKTLGRNQSPRVWIDRNEGSIVQPFYSSDACDCGNDSHLSDYTSSRFSHSV